MVNPDKEILSSVLDRHDGISPRSDLPADLQEHLAGMLGKLRRRGMLWRDFSPARDIDTERVIWPGVPCRRIDESDCGTLGDT